MKAYWKATVEIEFDSETSEECENDPEVAADFAKSWPYLEETVRNLLMTGLNPELAVTLTMNEVNVTQ